MTQLKQLNKSIHPIKDRKIKVMQFGEGNFLRAFVDWIIQKMNDSGAYNSNVVVVQPLSGGRVKELAEQDGLYTLLLEGIDNKKTVSTREVINVLSDFINPYSDYNKYLEYAKSQDLEVIVSNTTEAGISLDKDDTDFNKCPNSFPGKLLALLKARYDHFKGDKTKGLCIIPCELIDNNADELKKVLLELCEIKGYDKNFIDWVENSNHYSSTLVDRIVPGYPKDKIEQIQKECGYFDNSVVKGEIFHLWVLKKEPVVMEKFPAHKCGLNVIYADDIKPYKERKVKILNGSHTALVPLAYLAGIDTVGEAVTDGTIGKFVKDLIFEEINPTIKLPKDEMTAFANSVLERYENPFVRHELMSIALNSTTKFKTRLLPTLKDYISLEGKLPKRLLLAFAGLIEFHKGKRGNEAIALNDDPKLLAHWAEIFENNTTSEAIVKAVVSWTDAWGEDLSKLHPDLSKTVAGFLEQIHTSGSRTAVTAESGRAERN